MLSRGALSRLHTLTQLDSFTLSVYVDIDQNNQANRNRGFEVQTEAMLKELRQRHGDDQRLVTASARVVELVRRLEPQGRTALAVVHPELHLAELHEVKVALPASAHWQRGAFLRPVVEAMGEYERFAVVLTDKQRARLFTVDMGEVTEHSDLISATGQRTRTTGTDHIWSEKRFQRHHEQEVAQHGKRVVDALHDLSLRAPFDRLIIAGPTEATSQVARLLPRRLHGKLAETVSMSTSASPQEMLQKVLEVERQMELEQELLVVEGVLAELHEGGKAVSGLQAVVDAVNQGRVWKLVYVKGHAAQGSVCKGCGLHSHRRTGPCKACGGKVQVIPGFVEALSQAVVEVGGQVEVVSGSAAEKLGQQAPIAALLRY